MEIEDEFKKIIGLNARNIELGHGSFITLDFGEDLETDIKIRGKYEKMKRGEWQLWLYMCSWRIEKHDKIIIGSFDDREKISTEIQCINGKGLTSFRIGSFWDLELHFESSFKIKTFSNSFNSEEWMLYLPNKMTFTAISTNNYEYRK